MRLVVVLGPTRVASPWSETRASYDLVRRTLEDLMLPWETVGLCEWMYSMPRAAPRAMDNLVSQFRGVLPDPLLPVQWQITHINKISIEIYSSDNLVRFVNNGKDIGNIFPAYTVQQFILKVYEELEHSNKYARRAPWLDEF
ncbi:hypothetical protein M5K25_025428 [Dendrobium thyrsiflorum]|uniref:Uncharacterized protein n=1 Tax=Dendrobium thyrsiflorum TaxID=117978 RepID=A0ABD0U9F3_DENTH